MSKIIEEELTKTTIFKDESKLSIDYVPEHLPHREEEIKKLLSYLRCMIEKPGGMSQKILIIGQVGTGKTATSKLFGKSFTEAAEKRNTKISYIHINCHKNRTLFTILRKIIKEIIKNFPERGLSAQELYNVIRIKLEEEDRYLLLTLDEIDYFIRVGGEESLYDLIRMSDELLNQPQRISFIFIARDQTFLPLLDKSTKSVLMHNIIRFKPYTTDQLKDILKERIKEAFYEETINDEAINTIAEIAAESGDARYALEILWRTAKIAEQEGKKKIELKHIRKAASTIHPTIREEDLRNLTKHEKLLIIAIARTLRNREEKYITIGEAEETYKIICEEHNIKPRGHTKTWEAIQNLKNIGLINQQEKQEEEQHK